MMIYMKSDPLARRWIRLRSQPETILETGSIITMGAKRSLNRRAVNLPDLHSLTDLSISTGEVCFSGLFTQYSPFFLFFHAPTVSRMGYIATSALT